MNDRSDDARTARGEHSAGSLGDADARSSADPDGDASAAGIRGDASRKRAARASPPPSPLRGVGTFGMVGWSIAVPSVTGALGGAWLDRRAPQTFSWTLALLLAGVAVGVVIAWHWIERETRQDEERR